MGGPKAVEKAKRTAESILQRLVFESWKGFWLFLRGDASRIVAYGGNNSNLIRILDDYSFPMTLQDLSSFFKKPVLSTVISRL